MIPMLSIFAQSLLWPTSPTRGAAEVNYSIYISSVVRNITKFSSEVGIYFWIQVGHQIVLHKEDQI